MSLQNPMRRRWISMGEAFLGGITWRGACFYILAQVSGGILGAATANVMFALPLFTLSQHSRTGAPQWFSEFVATFGLIFSYSKLLTV